MQRLLNCSLLLCTIYASLLSAEPLRIVCSVPELTDLTIQIGGSFVTCDTLSRPQDNPHFINARPSFIRKLSRADAFIIIGLDLEVGWAPALINGARNHNIRPGKAGYIDCSTAISPLDKPQGTIDRSQGDVHPHGNPHYLLSPLCGIEVAGYVGERLAQLAPEQADYFKNNAQKVQSKIATAFFGKELVANYPIDDLITWQRQHNLANHIGDTALGGWLLDLQGLRNVALIDDHKQWSYLEQCFGFKIIGHLEPKPGIPPSTQHLQQVIHDIQKQNVQAIISAPWFNPRHAKMVATAANVPILILAHQAGSLDHTETYLKQCAYNVAQLKSLVSK